MNGSGQRRAGDDRHPSGGWGAASTQGTSGENHGHVRIIGIEMIIGSHQANPETAAAEIRAEQFRSKGLAVNRTVPQVNMQQTAMPAVHFCSSGRF